MTNIDRAHVPDTSPVPISPARRQLVRALVVAAACAALFTSGWGMWHFLRDQVTADWKQILPMFVLFDLAGVACAVMARTNRITYGQMGIAGWLVWVFAVCSGFMSSSDAHGTGAVFRFAAPLVAAVLFELLIQGERRDEMGGVSDGVLARLKRRAMARLGLLDALELSDADAAKAATAGKLATLAYRMHQTREGTWARRRAVRKYHRRLRAANERYRFALDEDMRDAVRSYLAAMYQGVSGTSEQSVSSLDIWRSGEPVGRGPVDQSGDRGTVDVINGSGVSAVGQWADIVRDPLGNMTAIAPVPPKVNGARRATEDIDAIVAEFSEQLRAKQTEKQAKGRALSRYDVEQITGLSARPAQRVLDAVSALSDASSS